MDISMREKFSASVITLIGTLLISVIMWVGSEFVVMKESVASFQTKQVENDRINELVYTTNSMLPTINSEVGQIKTIVLSNSSRIDVIAKEQHESNARLYCVSTYPIGGMNSAHTENVRLRAHCIEQLIGNL